MTSGIKIPGFKLVGNKVVVDRKAALKKLPVNKQIAARENAKNKVRFTRNPRPKGG